MALDPQFVIAPSLEQYFVDKTTGLPLAGGKVYFYSDVNRSNLKDVFKLSGSPPNYSYVALPNPSTLSAVGTFQDAGGNNILPYYYPYNQEGEIENYYIEVYSEDDVLQFTREAFPNAGGDDSDITLANAINYIPNGQFLLHNDIPADILNDLPAGRIREDVTEIAPGGWTFERSTGSTSVFNVTFPAYGEFVENPTASPRYACQITCTTADVTTTDNGIKVKFKDVNKFSAIPNRIYTIAFNAVTVNSGDFSATLRLIKFFGTGGTPSPTEIIPLETFLITEDETLFQHSFTFGNNDGTNLGTNGDDYVQIELAFPTNITYGIKHTNFLLLAGEVTVQSFPQTTDRDFITRSLPNLIPAHDGSDFALPVMVGMEGFYYDHSAVGKVIASFSSSREGHLLCDGSQYLRQGYSDLGVPYQRLYDVLLDAVPIPHLDTWLPGLALFGSGPHFCTAVTDNDGEKDVILHNNTAGVATAVTDGTVPTNFTITSVHVGTASYGVTSFWQYHNESANAFFSVMNNKPGSVTDTGLGDSGFSFDTTFRRREGSALIRNTQYISTNVPIGTLPGKYFTFNTVDAGFYVWYKVSGVGTDPAIGGRTGILVNLLNDDTHRDISTKTSIAISGYECSNIRVGAASTFNPGAYFNIHTIGGSHTYYYVWFTKDNVGTDPKPVGGIGIHINVAASATQAQVYEAMFVPINSLYFAVPDLRGQFLRGNDPRVNGTSIYAVDPRFTQFHDGLWGQYPGTFQTDEILSHRHAYGGPVNEVQAGTGDFGGDDVDSTEFDGGQESRPYNSSVNFFIKY